MNRKGLRIEASIPANISIIDARSVSTASNNCLKM